MALADSIIGSIRRQYMDTRTQANLSKLNAKSGQDTEIVTEHMSHIKESKDQARLLFLNHVGIGSVKLRIIFTICENMLMLPEMLERMMEAPRNVSPVWGSKTLEVIALKWTPLAISLAVACVILWSSSIIKNDFRVPPIL
ncbi:LOW QUALITY PROTEIN: hypothetical protein RJ640_023022 [Escallonia rubra]|uniref:Uncharacterized protein n=1 Tax=Escallonia rubra TaxID=112253 RepID=A0AA88QQS0_9ASTE|nr:LOW QUALITY PROTEIN: hypothetical protein RJ640_023022 [Escallonia rubra]